MAGSIVNTVKNTFPVIFSKHICTKLSSRHLTYQSTSINQNCLHMQQVKNTHGLQLITNSQRSVGRFPNVVNSYEPIPLPHPQHITLAQGRRTSLPDDAYIHRTITKKKIEHRESPLYNPVFTSFWQLLPNSRVKKSECREKCSERLYSSGPRAQQYKSDR